VLWVKVPKSGTDKLYLFYSNSSLAAGSSKSSTFSYSTAKNIYHELSHDFIGNMGITSFVDNNTVTVSTTTGTSTQTLTAQEVVTQANAQYGPISVTGPINARLLTTNAGSDSVVPLSLASTTMGYPMSRGNDEWDFYNPGTTTANVTLTHYNNSGAQQGQTTFTVGANEYKHVAYDANYYGLIESDLPLLGLYYAGSSDGVVMNGGGTELLGAVRSGRIGILSDETTGTIYYDDGSSTSFSGGKGESVALSGGGSQQDGISIRIVADKKVIAVGQADSDGSDSHAFLPVEELGSEYILPADAQYMIMTCRQDTNYTVYNPDQTINTSGTCSVNADSVGNVSFGAASGINYTAGTRVSGDRPFYLYYEYSDQDETSVFSYKQARSYSPTPPLPTLGSEQEWK
jgi:hypothetical protein